MEQDHAEDVAAAAEWGGKALAASRQGGRTAGRGRAADADRFDNLAKVALGRQMQSEKEARRRSRRSPRRREVVDKLRSGLDRMRTKLTELQAKRDELVARPRPRRRRTR